MWRRGGADQACSVKVAEKIWNFSSRCYSCAGQQLGLQQGRWTQACARRRRKLHTTSMRSASWTCTSMFMADNVTFSPKRSSLLADTGDGASQGQRAGCKQARRKPSMLRGDDRFHRVGVGARHGHASREWRVRPTWGNRENSGRM